MLNQILIFILEMKDISEIKMMEIKTLIAIIVNENFI
jgi:hypothetical protein